MSHPMKTAARYLLGLLIVGAAAAGVLTPVAAGGEGNCRPVWKCQSSSTTTSTTTESSTTSSPSTTSSTSTSSTSTSTTSGTAYSLLVSTSNTRSPSSVLAGQSYPAGSGIYVFTSPNTANISAVAFSVDGAPYHTEYKAPYDLAGSNDTTGTAYAYTVQSGTHTVSATISFSDGTSPVTLSRAYTGTGSGGGACAPGSTVTLTDSNVIQLDGDRYHLQANEWGSSAPFSIASDGCLDFTIATSQINNSTSGAPGAYPSLYKGCHWGYCTSNSGLPLLVSGVETPGTVTTSIDTTTIGTGAWDDAYDVWFNPTPTTSSGGQLEMMVWLTKLGPVQPAGSVIASNVSLGGRAYNVWYSGSGVGGTVSYVLASPTTSLSGLDLGALAADAASRHYMDTSWYLIDVEAGFEPWIGGAGLSVNSFSVCTPAGCS